MAAIRSINIFGVGVSQELEKGTQRPPVLHARGEAVRGEQRAHQLLRAGLLEDGQVTPA